MPSIQMRMMETEISYEEIHKYSQQFIGKNEGKRNVQLLTPLLNIYLQNNDYS